MLNARPLRNLTFIGLVAIWGCTDSTLQTTQTPGQSIVNKAATNTSDETQVQLEGCPYKIKFPAKPTVPSPLKNDTGSMSELSYKFTFYRADCICGQEGEEFIPENITKYQAEKEFTRVISDKIPDGIIDQTRFFEDQRLGKVLYVGMHWNKTIYGDRVLEFKTIFGKRCMLTIGVNRNAKTTPTDTQRFFDSLSPTGL
jgi:hypothetical protein